MANVLAFVSGFVGAWAISYWLLAPLLQASPAWAVAGNLAAGTCLVALFLFTYRLRLPSCVQELALPLRLLSLGAALYLLLQTALLLIFWDEWVD